MWALTSWVCPIDPSCSVDPRVPASLPPGALAVVVARVREARATLMAGGHEQDTVDSQGRIGHRWRRAGEAAFASLRSSLATRVAAHMRRFHPDAPAAVVDPLVDTFGLASCPSCLLLYRDHHAVVQH